MTREEAIEVLKHTMWKAPNEAEAEKILIATDMAIQALSQEPTDTWSIKEVADTFKKHGLIREQEPCDDAISREELLKAIYTWDKFGCDADTKLVRYQDHYIPYIHYDDVIKCIKGMPSVTQKSGKCKNCKYFEYDSVAKVDGIPLIVAHEICNKWGNGCKTKEDGYCFLFEPQESEDKE